MNSHKEKIVVIGGPTCIGKSDYAVELALKHNGEIIGADSVQIYKYLDIGSGKITKEEMRGIPHYLINIKEPDESFTVVDFMTEAKPIITDIISRGKLPILVGGTGFYINALLHGYDCGHVGPDANMREELIEAEKRHGTGYLYLRLKELEPNTPVRENDMPRITRRLELLLSPGDMPAPDPDREAYDALLVVMDADREAIDAKAAKRISKMIDGGFLREVAGLERYFGCRALGSVGYAEAVCGLKNGLTREEIEADMRHGYHALIKKQQTFFKWIKWRKKAFVTNWNYESANNAVKEFSEH